MLHSRRGGRPERRAAVLLLFAVGCQGDGAFPPEEQLSPARVSATEPSAPPSADSPPPGAAVDTVAVPPEDAPRLMGAAVRGGAVVANGRVLGIIGPSGDPSGGDARAAGSVIC